MRVRVEVVATCLDEFITKINKLGADLCFIEIIPNMKYHRGRFIFNAFITWVVGEKITRALGDMLSEKLILSMVYEPYPSRA